MPSISTCSASCNWSGAPSACFSASRRCCSPVGASAIGWTTQGDRGRCRRHGGGVRWSSRSLLLVGGRGQRVGRQRAAAAPAERPARRARGSRCPTCSCCRSAPRSASTRSGCCCTTRRARSSRRSGRCGAVRIREWLTRPPTRSDSARRCGDRRQRRRGARLCRRLGDRRRAARVRTAEQVRPLSRAAVDDRLRRPVARLDVVLSLVPLLGWILAIFVIPPSRPSCGCC